jgi:acetyl-CoA acetyltransferase
MQFAFGGSLAGSLPGGKEPNADAVVAELGLTGLQFVNVVNGCATAGSSLLMAASTIESGAYDLGVAVGFDKHPRGHFNADPGQAGLPQWYGDLGFMITTQFFAMKINRYMHDHEISVGTLAKVAAKAYRNGALNPNAWRRKPFSEEEILESRMLNYPLTQYMFCSPDEGAAAVVMCRADQAHKYTDRPVYLRAVTVRTRRFGSFEVFAPWLPVTRTESPTVDASRACYEQAGIGPAELDLAQIQDSEAGAEVMHMAENGLCADGEQEAMIQAGETEIGGRLPINTDGGLIANGEPIGASGMRQVYETVLQLRGDAGERQVPNDPAVGYTQVYGAPGVGACTLLTR